MIRFGLCCLFVEEPIKFRATTAKALKTLDRPVQLQKISGLCLENTESLLLAVKTVHRLGIGAYRITSPLFPRYTHPEVGYRLEELPEASEIFAKIRQVKSFATKHDIRLSLHPDQFTLLSSPKIDVVRNSLAELEYHGMLAALVGASVINIHGGGGYGNKKEALGRVKTHFADLSESVRSRITFENDDTTYNVEDLLPLCEALKIPLVYDVHHHRCYPDGLSVEAATTLAAGTWQRRGQEPYFHLSSPKNGWGAGNPRAHADYIDVADFPRCWLQMTATVDLEAKAKELAVVKLIGDLSL